MLEVQVFVKLGELDALPGLAAHPTRFAGLDFPRPEPGKPPAVIRVPEADLAQLAVADDIDARVRLFADGLRDAGLHPGHDRSQIGTPAGHKTECHLT